MLHKNTSLNVKSIFQGPYDKNPQSLIIWNCKCTQNIHYTGSSGCRDSFNQHVHSFQGFCSLRQLLHLSMNTPPLLLHCSKLFICQPADFYKKNHWQGWEIFEIRFTMQATWVVLFVLSCETIVSIVKLFAVQVLRGGGSALTSSPSSPPGMHISEILSCWSHACSEHLQEKKQHSGQKQRIYIYILILSISHNTLRRVIVTKYAHESYHQSLLSPSSMLYALTKCNVA